MGYYYVTDGGLELGEYDDFGDALEAALDAARSKAELCGVDESEIDTYQNGRGPWRDDDPTHRGWEAGACPNEHDGEGWPRVKWCSDGDRWVRVE